MQEILLSGGSMESLSGLYLYHFIILALFRLQDNKVVTLKYILFPLWSGRCQLLLSALWRFKHEAWVWELWEEWKDSLHPSKSMAHESAPQTPGLFLSIHVCFHEAERSQIPLSRGCGSKLMARRNRRGRSHLPQNPGILGLVLLRRAILSGKAWLLDGKHVEISAKHWHPPLLTLEHLKKHLWKEKLLVVSLKTHPTAS